VYDEDAELFSFQRKKISDLPWRDLSNLVPYRGNEAIVNQACEEIIEEARMKKKHQIIEEEKMELD